MAGKPEHHHHHLQQQQSTQQSSVQNVVVYVSDNNFAYAVNQQHHNVYPQQQNGGGSFGSAVVMPTGGKGTVSKPPHQGKDFSPGNGPVPTNFYGAGASMQANGFHHCHSANYGGVNSVSTFKSPVQEVLQDGYSLQRTFFERQKSETPQIDQPGTGLVAVVGDSSNNVFPRCDSVRSETAESSCSSLSSGDSQLENGQTTFIQKQQAQQQLGNVVLAVTPSVQAQPSQSVSVPFGWKRLHIGGSIVYISPSNTALSSLELLKVYLQTQGTCKCGLECPLQCEVVFNFDPKVVTRPWSAEGGDSDAGGRMCQHKRKLMSMTRPKKIGAENVMDAASLKRKKRKLANSGAVASNSSVSQLLATREQTKAVWDANVSSSPVVGISQAGVTRPQLPPPPPPPPNFEQVHQQQQQQQQQHQQQFVRYQTPIDPTNTVMQQHQYQDIQQLRMHMYQTQLQQHQEQQKVIQQQVRPQFPPTSVPGCPQPSYDSYHRLQQTNQQQMILTNNGSNTGGSPQLVMTNSGNLLNNNASNNVNSNGGMLLIPHHQQPQRTPPWQTRAGNNCASTGNNSIGNSNNMVVGNGYERVPPLHHHTPPPHPWTEDSSRKKHKTPKSATSPAGAIKKQRSPEPAPNIDVRQIPSDGNRPQGAYQPSSGPSFMEDPSGYLAQQTALLNSTISRQTASTGGNSNFVCHSPQQQQQQPQQPQQQQPQTQIMMGLPQAVPLPSNVLLPKGYNPRSTVSASIQQQSVAVSSYSIQQPATSYSIQQNPQQTVTVSSYSIQQPNQQPVVSSYSVQQNPQQTVTSYNIHQQPHQAMTVSSFNIQHQQHAQHQQTMSSYSIQQHQPQQQQAVAVSSYNIQQQHHPPQQAMIHISVPPDSSVVQQQETTQHCQGCAHDAAVVYQQDRSTIQPQFQIQFQQNRSTETGNSASEDNPVTSSTFSDRSCGNNTIGRQIPDTRGPIQGGTVSTSNVSPVEACYSTTLLPQPEASPTSSSTPTPRQPEGNILISSSSPSPFNASPPGIVPYQYPQQQQRNNGSDRQPRLETYCQHVPEQTRKFTTTVTTMASGHTVSSNTITSVLAGRAQTATVSVGGAPADISQQQQIQQQQPPQQQSKSPLEMVQSVVSSIQVPQQLKQQPPNAAGQLPPGHILVSSGGQLLVAQPQPQPQQQAKSMLTGVSGVSAAVSQVGPWQPLATLSPVIPAAVGVVGQPATVLVNTLPAPLLIQPGVMAVDGSTVQIPHLAVGNMLQQSPQLVDTNDSRGQTTPSNFHPQHQQPQQRLHTHHTLDANTNGRKKSTKKRKVSPQTVASMLHIAQQNQSLVLPQPQQGYTSTQGLGTMLTIVPGKGGAPAQIVMGNSGQPTTPQAPPQQPPPPAPQPAPAPATATASINLLQPVNLAAGTVVQNFPAFQQFIVPGLGGMVMAADGTATLLPDANLGVQLQLQSVNGQSVLTPVQTSPHGFGQPSLPAGMVIRGAPATGTAPSSATNTGKFLSPSNGTQFLVNSAAFGGQLSPLVANVSPTQHHQVAFQTQSPAPSVQPQRPPPQQEFLPCAPAAAPHQTPSHHNTTVVQQNTTIVQQQTTMVSNSQQLLHNNFGATGNGNFVQNYQPQPTTHLRQQPQPHAPMMKHSVSTQTAVNQSVQVSNSPPNQSVAPPTTLSVATSNTFCQTSGTVGGGSPPDTTTHSPAADTTTEGLASPCPVTGSGDSNTRVRHQAPSSGSTMPMVHCVSSSNEQDSLGPDFDWTAPRPPFVESSSASNLETFSKQDICRKRKVEGQPHSLEEEEEEVAN